MPDNFKKEENGVNIGNADSPKKIYILQIRIIPVLKPIKSLLQKLRQKPKAKRAVLRQLTGFSLLLLPFPWLFPFMRFSA